MENCELCAIDWRRVERNTSGQRVFFLFFLLNVFADNIFKVMNAKSK